MISIRYSRALLALIAGTALFAALLVMANQAFADTSTTTDEVGVGPVVVETVVVDGSVVTDPAPTGEVLGETTETSVVEETTSTTEEVTPAPEAPAAPEATVAPEAPVTTPTLTTDKDDYHPGETVSIFGKIFGALQEIVLKIFGSDDNDQNYVESTQTVTTDADGSFSTTFTLDDLYRPFYEMTASTLDGTLLASGWFRDAAVDAYDQCSNDDGDGYATGDAGCRWINGAINGNNSVYQEGDSTVQRLSLEGFAPGTAHTVTIQYGTTKQGKHAYDFLTTYNDSEDWITVADRCDGIFGCDTAADTAFPIPNDTNGSGQFQGTVGTRDFTMRGGTITAVTNPSLSGSYGADSETSMTVTFTVANSGSMCSTKGQVTSCGIALFFGAHVAKGADWTVFNGTTGAGSIAGSPYHVAITELDGGSIGNRDNQMQAGSVPSLATLTLLKTVVNDNGGNAVDTDWTLAANGPTPISGVEGSLAVTSALVDAGDYTLSESGGPAGYAASQYSCIKNGGQAVLGNSITLAPSDVATCTITNDDIAPKLILQKTVNNDNGGTAEKADFQAKVDGNNVAWDAETSVSAGAHTASETNLPGYTASAWGGDCSADGSVTLTLGETKTCTITNDDQPAHITVIKVVQNNYGGTKGANDFGLKIGATSVTSGASNEVNAGTYTVSEATFAGYEFVSFSGDCDSNGSVTVGLGGSKTCTVTNQDKPGHLIVHKVTDPANDPALFSVTLDAAPVSGSATRSISATTSVDYTVVAGTYSVSESAKAGWDETGNTCASVSVAIGETKECTITNTKRGHVIIKKDAVPNDVQDFAFHGSGSIGDFMLDDDGNESNSLKKQQDFEVLPGTYAVSEDAVSGWKQKGATCTDGSPVDAIDVAPGETVTCTFVNEKLAKLILVKNTTGGNGTFDFTMTGETLAPTAQLTTVGGTASTTFSDLDPDNTYSIAETVPAGWVQTGVTCSNKSSSGTVTARDPSGFQPTNGGVVTCTFANSKPDAHITIDPLSATNNIHDPHVFTVEVTQVPNGATPALTADVSALVVPTPGLQNDTTCDALVPFVGNTATCTVTINSGVPGVFTATATSTVVIGGVSLTRATDGTGANSGGGMKTYVAGALELSKLVTLGGYLFPDTVDTSFTLHVEGPSYPSGTDLVFDVVDGVPTNSPQALSNLIPGDYTVTETGVDTAAWTVSGTGGVKVNASATSTKAVTNTLKIPNTSISITPSVYETEPGQNVVLTIADTNNGQTPITNPSVELYANNVLVNPQPAYTGGDTNTNGILDVGETWTWSTSALITVNTTFVVNGMGVDPLGNPVNGPTYPGETKSATVKVIGTTRTLGFWQTHTNFTSAIFSIQLGGSILVGDWAVHKGPVDTAGKVFGGFYAPIAKTTLGAKRTPIDQSRIQMLQQLLAAKLNCAAFGCSGATQTLIANADAAYAAGSSKSALNALTSQLDAFNNSGDANAIPSGLPATGKATPKTSQSIANTAFWDQP